MQTKNLFEEKVRKQIQDMQDNPQLVELTDRIYKPTHTIEFDRCGEVLLYSCEPRQHVML